MKIGFWNRLAIVGAALLMLIGPTWMLVSQNAATSERMQEGYTACMATGVEAGESDLSYCWDHWMEGQYFLGFNEWLEMVGVAAILAAVFYAMIWCAVRIAKWVWRGRAVR